LASSQASQRGAQEKYLERLVESMYGGADQNELKNLSQALPNDQDAFSPHLQWPDEENEGGKANRGSKRPS